MKGVVGVSHVSLSSIVEMPALVEEISQIQELDEKRWMGYQTGIETGSPRFIRKLMPFKPYPFKPEEWPEVVEEAFSISTENNWIPVATLIVNLLGENEDDVVRTTKLVERLKDYKSLVIPLLYGP